jgi:ZIP family zinc transporter
MVAASFWSLLAPAIEMTGGEGFAKVMPAFGFPWCLIYFGIDKVLPIFISILKLAKGSNHHGNEPPCWFQLHCITFQRIGCWSSFGGVAAGIPEASIAGAVTLAIGLEFRIFLKELPCQCLCEEWE